MKGQNLATVTHIHVFLSNKGKWETPAIAEALLITPGAGVGRGMAGRVPFPNQYGL